MIRLVIEDIKELTEREAVALGHMFMHLAGHTLHAAPPTQSVPTVQPTISTPPVPPTIPTPPVSITTEGTSLEIIPEFFEPVPIPTSTEAPVLDSNGIPWDARIHARNKSKTASGVWKLGRNISSDYVKQVLAELRGAQPVPMPPVSMPAEQPIPMPPIPVPMPQPVPMPPIPVSASQPVDTADAAAELYENLLNTVTAKMGNGSLTIAIVNTILRNVQGFSINNLAALGTFSDADKLVLIPRIIDEINKAAL